MGTAVVLGGSIAGLLAARVLCEHAQTVVVVERDDVETGAARRSGVPQSGQIHNLLAAGRVQLERWFPGFMAEAEAAGGVLSDLSRTARYQNDTRLVALRGQRQLTASRELLEALIRRRALAAGQVRIVLARARGLEFAGSAVCGVRVEDAEGRSETIAADLVVDAMGRHSQTAGWLAAEGWCPPRVERVYSGVNYVTGVFSRASGVPDLGLALIRYSQGAGPEDLYAAAASAIEDNRWMVLLAGLEDHWPGRTEDEFRRLCALLPAPFPEAVQGEMEAPIATYRMRDNQRRRYDELAHLPARLVAVGDAVASFNPTWGQGISSAALHASTLSYWLCDQPDLGRMPVEFFALQRVVVDAAWEMSAGADLERTAPSGPGTVWARMRRWLRSQIMLAAIDDPGVARRVGAVTAMMAHPDTLNEPSLALRAVLVNHRPGAGRPDASARVPRR
ncbi:FAD-dependent monooxygenase [Pseudonocardia spinosispora]|uniref:FAD-dependent monooxygenase n=1 Tax=Pseudonocardia spinosispora TaxID=103441 RepID=UPI0012EB4750|nr:FAD-dependent monooxygenase [Pseudonocardia spinosispora]